MVAFQQTGEECDPRELTCDGGGSDDTESSIVDRIIDLIGEGAEETVPGVDLIDDAVALPGAAAEEMAGAMVDGITTRFVEEANTSLVAFRESMASSLTLSGDTLSSGVLATVRPTAGTILTIGALLAVLGVMVRRRGLWDAVAPIAYFAFVVSFGAAVITGFAAAADELVARSVVLELADTEIEEAPMIAAMVLPPALAIVEFAFSMRSVLVIVGYAAVIIGAALRIFMSSRRAFAVAVAFVAATVLWPLMSGLAAGAAVSAIPSLWRASLWLFVAGVLAPVFTYAIAFLVVKD